MPSIRVRRAAAAVLVAAALGSVAWAAPAAIKNNAELMRRYAAVRPR